MENQNSLVAALVEHGVCRVSMSAALVDAVLLMERAWCAFVLQPMSHKASHIAQHGAAGYEYREAGLSRKETKETFEVNMLYVLPAGSSEIDKAYIDAAQRVLRLSTSMVLSTAENLPPASDSGSFFTMMRARQNFWVVRSIHYFPLQMKQVQGEALPPMAVGHADLGHSFHLYESAAGFRTYWNGVWQSLEPQHLVAGRDAKALTYGGLLTQYYTECKIKALCHRVDYTEDTELCGRTSHVLFVGFGQAMYDKDTWGSSQSQFPMGENYDLEPSVFKRYFRPFVHESIH